MAGWWDAVALAVRKVRLVCVPLCFSRDALRACVCAYVCAVAAAVVCLSLVSEGPSRDMMLNGYWKHKMIGLTEAAAGQQQQVRGEVGGKMGVQAGQEGGVERVTEATADSNNRWGGWKRGVLTY